MSHLLKFLIERVGLFPIFLIGYKHQAVKLVFDYLNFIIFYFYGFKYQKKYNKNSNLFL